MRFLWASRLRLYHNKQMYYNNILAPDMTTLIDRIAPSPKSKLAQEAKQNLTIFVAKVDQELGSYFKSELLSPFGKSSQQQKLFKIIWQHIKEQNLHPAKRLRGSFMYYGYKLLGGKKEKDILFASMSVELIHTALLMHDDFMDQDPMRRGSLSTHEYFKLFHKKSKYKTEPQHFGESMAVDIGDIGLFAGSEIIMRTSFADDVKVKAGQSLFRALMETGMGQADDISIEAKRLATEKEILALHHAKTGIYTYENPLHLGAILAGASQKDLDLLSKYAIPGGIAFQLQDDILGLFGDPAKTGKPAHSDLRQGKVTLLIIKAMELGTKKQRQILNSIWGKKDLTESEAHKAREIIIATGSLNYSLELSRRLAKKAQRALTNPHSKSWNTKALSYLDGIAQYMVEREV